MNEPIGIDRDGNEIVLMDLLRCDDSELVEEVDRNVQKKAVRKAVQNLQEDRERLIIQLRYGLLNGAEKITTAIRSPMVKSTPPSGKMAERRGDRHHRMAACPLCAAFLIFLQSATRLARR